MVRTQLFSLGTNLLTTRVQDLDIHSLSRLALEAQNNRFDCSAQVPALSKGQPWPRGGYNWATNPIEFLSGLPVIF